MDDEELRRALELHARAAALAKAKGCAGSDSVVGALLGAQAARLPRLQCTQTAGGEARSAESAAVQAARAEACLERP